MDTLREVFGDRINPYDFYLWGIIKQTVYRSSPHTTDELKKNIQREVPSVSQELQHGSARNA
jgi:hypothetical protein